MKSQALSCSLIASAASEFGFNPNRDVCTVIERVAHEGEQFLTITLPRLSDGLLEGLESSLLPSLEGWKKKRGTALPEFLFDLWTQVFAPSGTILSNPSARAVYWLRQISVAFKKVFDVCAPQYVEEALAKFFDVDAHLPRRVYAAETVSEVAHWLFGKPVGSAITSWETVFKNGPGAVADRLDVNERWDFPTISPHIEAAFGADRFRSSWSDLLFRYPAVREIPARITAVPKTATKPRLISIEPSHNQYLQQSLMSALYDELSFIWAVDIRRQEPNQLLAQEGSQIDGGLATIDLSDASDRISNDLVETMFGWNPSFVRFLEATRSREIVTSDGTRYFLRKFASMGSALTFPIETMVFATIVVMAMCIQDGDLSKENAEKHFHSRKVRVYGDDIIVPSPYFQSVVQLLQRYGMAVNRSKSFVSGLFRESCGKDWFSGVDVTPKYVRRSLNNGRLTDEAVVSLCAFHNQMYESIGDTETTHFVRELLEESHPGIPRISVYSERLIGGLYLFGEYDNMKIRFNPNLQLPEAQTYFLRSTTPETRGGWQGKLLQALVGPKSENPDRLFQGGRPLVARLRRGWREIL